MSDTRWQHWFSSFSDRNSLRWLRSKGFSQRNPASRSQRIKRFRSWHLTKNDLHTLLLRFEILLQIEAFIQRDSRHMYYSDVHLQRVYVCVCVCYNKSDCLPCLFLSTALHFFKIMNEWINKSVFSCSHQGFLLFSFPPRYIMLNHAVSLQGASHMTWFKQHVHNYHQPLHLNHWCPTQSQESWGHSCVFMCDI